MFSYLLGIPFKHFGRDPTVGLDCLGVIAEVYKKLGKKWIEPYPDYAEGWYKQPGDNLFLTNYNKGWVQVPKPEIYCTILMRWGSKELPNHAGVLISDSYVLHAMKNAGVVQQPAYRIKNKFHSFYRYTGKIND